MTRHWHWGTKIALTYIVFATGTLTMVGIAVSQRTDLVTPDYYARALKQDERMAAQANTAALGRAFEIASSDNDRLVVRWPHQPDAGSLVLYRPSNADADRTVVLAATATGTGAEQEIRMGDLSRGLWRVQVTWSWQGRPYYAEQDVVLR